MILSSIFTATTKLHTDLIKLVAGLNKSGPKMVFSSVALGQRQSNSSESLTPILKIFDDVNDAKVQKTSDVLKSGGVIAIPTDTLYGLAAIAGNPKATDRIYEIKKRNTNCALAICVADIEDIKTWAKVNEPTQEILNYLLPGPVTILLERSDNLFPHLNPENSNVGVRIPQHDFIRKVIREIGSPLALTSANISGKESTLSTQEFKNLWPQLDLVVDGGTIGPCEDGSKKGSTIIDLTKNGYFSVVRCGINNEEISKMLMENFHLKEK